MNNIYEEIAMMRKGMRKIGCTIEEEVEEATKDVTTAESYEEAFEIIKKYWK